MSDSVAKDYLGHPCQVTIARQHFDEMVDQARRNAGSDGRAISRRIGRLLNDIDAKLSHLAETPDVVLELLPSDTDSDPARAVLAMAKPYGVDICNQFAELAGYALLALDVGGVAFGESEGATNG